ncbi:DNA/RNA non-specific endonuclease [Acinetobacter rudis]|uniref:Endonuclease n=1 Tax=Acinetobacter rudis TaxID=632955 RepID=A0AAW8JAI3_9GAMM|nr:DNA/RNA non-specific endonuclease [Acinetobacter rudis]MDQ8936105.1 DNA/RNA non-specific endonuclease [Acinetobacter rudis]MDQ8952798.1 DNA/RNA non-specific endonuclease [Acinetobacter rudis]MDQ9018368.1 DNA/RNA non-specific endonuclease [Acinetobacter rudis]
MKTSSIKILLGGIVSIVVAFVFGQDKIAQYIPAVQSKSGTCLGEFYRQQPPYLNRESLQNHTYPLCFDGFNVMYSGVSKTPLWVAEHLYPERLSQKIKREDSFHEELKVSSQHRALLSDYRGSGYDRGHMAPNGDMSTKSSQADSFSLANMVPQAPKNNQQIWRELEEATRAIVTKQKQDVYVVTGPVFNAKKLKTIGNGVLVPTAVYKAIYVPNNKSGTHKGAIGVYYAPNNNSLQVQVISVCKLEELTGINIFTQLSEDAKRDVYQLPLTAQQVKPNQSINYAFWDGESQCAKPVAENDLQALQRKFQPNASNSTLSVANNESTSGNQSSNDVPPQLIQSLLHYVLKYLAG